MSIIQPTLTPVQVNGDTTEKHWWRKKQDAPTWPATPKLGDACPACGEGALDYDGLFLLVCDHCGKVAESGAFT